VKIVQGSVWDFYDRGARVVVPTNCGWRADGSAVMGAGVAGEAAKRFPSLPDWYGAVLRMLRAETPVVCHLRYRLVLFPTKPLDEEFPHLSWRQNADLGLIRRSASQLAVIPGEIALPLVGCGQGKLALRDVVPLLAEVLGDDRFVLVVGADHAVAVADVVKGLTWD